MPRNKTYPPLRADLPYETVGGRSIFKNVRTKIVDRAQEQAFLETLSPEAKRDYVAYHYGQMDS
ncbi:MAG: hypothetical protein EOP83_28210 [Verrucomicrobiaceae bacterium]|nr:MAG: hypothetical protein EOP83_28210 [Verrucomicrobiaceae bacterium]